MGELITGWELIDDVPGSDPPCPTCLVSMTLTDDEPYRWECADCGITQLI